MSAGFTNPNFGNQVRVEQRGREVHLIFVGASEAEANDIVDNILGQLKAGAIKITISCQPTSAEARSRMRGAGQFNRCNGRNHYA